MSEITGQLCSLYVLGDHKATCLSLVPCWIQRSMWVEAVVAGFGACLLQWVSF